MQSVWEWGGLGSGQIFAADFFVPDSAGCTHEPRETLRGAQDAG